MIKNLLRGLATTLLALPLAAAPTVDAGCKVTAGEWYSYELAL